MRQHFQWLTRQVTGLGQLQVTARGQGGEKREDERARDVDFRLQTTKKEVGLCVQTRLSRKKYIPLMIFIGINDPSLRGTSCMRDGMHSQTNAGAYTRGRLQTMQEEKRQTVFFCKSEKRALGINLFVCTDCYSPPEPLNNPDEEVDSRPVLLGIGHSQHEKQQGKEGKQGGDRCQFDSEVFVGIRGMAMQVSVAVSHVSRAPSRVMHNKQGHDTKLQKAKRCILRDAESWRKNTQGVGLPCHRYSPDECSLVLPFVTHGRIFLSVLGCGSLGVSCWEA